MEIYEYTYSFTSLHSGASDADILMRRDKLVRIKSPKYLSSTQWI